MASVAGDPPAVVARGEVDDVIDLGQPVKAARALIDVANVDVGAASVAASAGDFEIAYELLQDAIVTWQRATDVLLDAAADDEVAALPRRTATVDLRSSSLHAEQVDEVVVRPTESGASSPVEAGRDELVLQATTPSVQAGADEPAIVDTPSEPADGFFRRRRRAAQPDGPRADGDDLVLDDVLAAYVLGEETEAEIAEYDAWVDRLHDKRRQLQRSVRDIDRWDAELDQSRDPREG
jgi:hypothetical protein